MVGCPKWNFDEKRFFLWYWDRLSSVTQIGYEIPGSLRQFVSQCQGLMSVFADKSVWVSVIRLLFFTLLNFLTYPFKSFMQNSLFPSVSDSSMMMWTYPFSFDIDWACYSFNQYSGLWAESDPIRSISCCCVIDIHKKKL